MKQFFKKFIEQCLEEFLEEERLDKVDIAILDNYNDYIIEKMEIFFDNMKGKH